MKTNYMFLITFMLLYLIVSCTTVNRTETDALATISFYAVEGAGVSPVGIPLDAISFNTDAGRPGLFDMNDPLTEIPSQLETGLAPKLWFMFDHAAGDRTFALRMLPADSRVVEVSAVLTDESATKLLLNGQPVFRYHHAEADVPAGVDPVFRRSAFIHPLWSPGGEVLTRIQPGDHYHHYGIWNPWTGTTIEGVGNVDFWNLGSLQGRVRFGGYLAKETGPVYGGLKVRQEHVAYIPVGSQNELLAINELWDVRAWNTGQEDIGMVDFTSTLNSPLPDGIMLNQFRYGGGIGYRATEKWGKDNSTVLTSEGKLRDETDATEARWCIIEGESDVKQGRSGVLFLSHPSNRMHPEPMRMWDSNAQNGVGNIFFQFTPIRHEGWQIEPNKSYSLKYRMILFDGEMSAEEAEAYWKAFARAPGAVIQ